MESKVPTVRANDVAEVYRWVPAQVSTSSLDRGSKLRGVIGCVKASRRLEIDSRKRSYLLPNTTIKIKPVMIQFSGAKHDVTVYRYCWTPVQLSASLLYRGKKK